MGDVPGLSDEQRRALDRLSRLPIVAAFYLAGGTGLAVALSGAERTIDPGAGLLASAIFGFARVEIADRP